MKQTREDIIDLFFALKALEQKAACREVNCEILDELNEAIDRMNNAYQIINKIIEENG